MIDPLLCLATTIYFESSGESLKGKIAVGHVVLQRVEQQFRGKTTICEVVKDRNQFSYLWDGKPDTIPTENKLEVRAWEESYLVASALLSEGSMGDHIKDMTEGALHYHAIWMKEYPDWACDDYYIKIDQHLFYPDIKTCKKKAPRS